jgi:hypothetical protein
MDLTACIAAEDYDIVLSWTAISQTATDFYDGKSKFRPPRADPNWSLNVDNRYFWHPPRNEQKKLERPMPPVKRQATLCKEGGKNTWG